MITNLSKIINRKLGHLLVALPSDREATLEVTVERVTRVVAQYQNVILKMPGQHWSLRQETPSLYLLSEMI